MLLIGNSIRSFNTALINNSNNSGLFITEWLDVADDGSISIAKNDYNLSLEYSFFMVNKQRIGSNPIEYSAADVILTDTGTSIRLDNLDNNYLYRITIIYKE